MLAKAGGSGLRNQVSDDDSADEVVIPNKSKKRSTMMDKLTLGKGKSSNTRI